MKVFIDTEFSEKGAGKPIQLLSIGIVSEDGREYYAQNHTVDMRDLNPWVVENVVPSLEHFRCWERIYSHAEHECPWKSPEQMRKEIVEFVGDSPQFMGWYADYDWVVLCQLFGSMVELPEGWPMYCYDVKQFCDDIGNPKMPRFDDDRHHALADARATKARYEWLMGFIEQTLKEATRNHYRVPT